MTDSEFDGAAGALEAEIDAADHPTAYAVANACCREADWDIGKATQLLVDRLSADPAMLEALFPLILRQWSRASVRSVLHRQRASLAQAPTKAAQEAQQERLRNFAVHTVKSWLDDFRLQNGKALGDCTKADLLAEVEHYQVRARKNAARAAFLTRVARRVKDKVVRETLTEEQVAAMYQQTEAAAV